MSDADDPVAAIETRVGAMAVEILALARELGRPPSRVAVAEAGRRLTARREASVDADAPERPEAPRKDSAPAFEGLDR